MATRFKGIGIIVSHNKLKEKVVTPPSPSPAITKRLDRLDLGASTWSSKADMNEARAGFALHSVGDFLYAIGGTDGAKIHKSVEEYDVFTDTWELRTEMPTARCYFLSVEQDGYVYCIGGLTADAVGTTSISRKVERYDAVTDEWVELANLPSGYGVVMGTAQVVGDFIYILSGYKNEFEEYLDRVLVYDIATDEWEVEGVLSALEVTMYRRLLPFSFIEAGYIYVVNGLYYEQPEPVTDEEGEVVSTPDAIVQHLPDAFKYQLSNGEITRAEPAFIDMPRARFAGTTTSVGNDHYFVGGIGKTSNTLRFFERVNVSTDPFSYSDAIRLQRGRSSHGAAVHDGDYGDAIFVSGGVMSRQSENFLKVEVDAIPPRVRLDGKQSANVQISVFDENEESPDEVKIRLSAVGGDDDLILFTTDEIIVKYGRALATLIPRSDDGGGEVAMSDDAERSYDVSISGAVIDANYYGDTTPAPPPEDGDNGSVTDGATKFAFVNLPRRYNPVYRFETVISPDQTTPGNYFSTNLTDIGGFLALRPSVNNGGRDTTVRYFSDISWLPQVVPLIESNEGDYDEVRAALDRVSRQMPFGGSPIMDAVYKSGEIFDFDVSGVRKLIYVLTDGQENCSHYTTEESLEKINSINGVANTPIVSSQFRVVPTGLYLDQGVRSGSTDMEYLATETRAQSLYVATDSDVDESIRTLLAAKGFVGSGIFTFELDLGEHTLIETLRANFMIPENTNAFWRYAVGNESRKFRLFTDRLEPNEDIELTDTHGRYIRFVMEFSATLAYDAYLADKIEPPVLTTVEVEYHKKRESYIFLNPTDTTEDPQQVVITLDASRPNGSEILLGVNDAVTGTWEDYNSPSAPAVENNSRVVIPIRKTVDGSTYTLEKLVSVDGFIFETTYGKWAQESTVVIYKDGEEIVPESEYKIIPHKGRVVFAYKTEDDYVISIENKPRLSVAAKIVNRVNGKPIQITGAGYMYSTAKAKSGKGGERIVPEATNLLITPLRTDRDSVFRANYTYSDLKGRTERATDNGGTIITWFVNDEEEIDLLNLQQWDNKSYNIVLPGDVVYFTVEPATMNGNALLLGRKVRSLPVTVG